MRRAISQLFKEFIFPFTVAVLWTVWWFYEANEPDRTWIKGSATFGSAFFFVSWLSGQIFRVRKQQSVEEKLQTIESNIRSVIEELREATLGIVGQTTGGRGVCYMTSHVDTGGHKLSFLHGVGEYPMYDVRLEICDLDAFARDPGSAKHYPTFSFPIVLPNIAYSFDYVFPVDPNSPHRRSFNIFYFARNGYFTQKIRLISVDGLWLMATCVANGSPTPAYEWVQEGYPRNADGTVNWD